MVPETDSRHVRAYAFPVFVAALHPIILAMWRLFV
jgi:hypothetical protein